MSKVCPLGLWQGEIRCFQEMMSDSVRVVYPIQLVTSSYAWARQSEHLTLRIQRQEIISPRHSHYPSPICSGVATASGAFHQLRCSGVKPAHVRGLLDASSHSLCCFTYTTSSTRCFLPRHLSLIDGPRVTSCRCRVLF